MSYVHATSHLLCNVASELSIPVALFPTNPIADSQPVRHHGKLLLGNPVSCCGIGCVLGIWPHGALRAVIMQLLQKLIGEPATLRGVPLTSQLLRPPPGHNRSKSERAVSMQGLHSLLKRVCLIPQALWSTPVHHDDNFSERTHHAAAAEAGMQLCNA